MTIMQASWYHFISLYHHNHHYNHHHHHYNAA